jgi:hypothetical protein
MSDAVDAVLSVFQLIGAVIVLAAEIAETVDRNNQRKRSLQQLAQQKENALMERLLRPGWQQRIALQWFATHTICQRCERFFDTTNPKDGCENHPYHTFTPVLDNTVRRVVSREYGKQAPELFLPGRPFYRQVREVRPPQPLESDWVLMGENDNDKDIDDDDDEFEDEAEVAESEVTPGAPAEAITPVASAAATTTSVAVAAPVLQNPKKPKKKTKQERDKNRLENQQRHAAAKAKKDAARAAYAARHAASSSTAAEGVPSVEPSAPPIDADADADGDAIPRSGPLAHNSAELLQLAVMPDGVEPVSEKEAIQSYRRLLATLSSSLSPAELELLPNLPHPPDVDPGIDEDDDLAALPHPPSNDPSVAPPPSYSAAVARPGQ